MAAEEKPVTRATMATVIATAAVTLAIGVTAAALGGYLVPAGAGNKASTEAVAETVPLETRPAPQPSAPNVVLVPVAPDSRGGSPVPPANVPAPRAADVVFAAYQPSEHDDDDHHRRGEHREDREHEDDHEDDD